MKRSSAPSSQSLPAGKRGKFLAPFKANVNQFNRPNVVAGPGYRVVKGINTLQESKEKENENASIADTPASKTEKENVRYYNVVWCKASKKKHKKWDGDGVLLVNIKSVLLKDSEGKDIGRSSGFKSAELQNLVDGSTLFVGNKEVEVLDEISQDMYKSGRCFVQFIRDASCVTKPFRSPANLAGGNSALSKTSKEASVSKPTIVEPRHNPNADNAIVMPRPSASHQWLHNKQGLPVVDVVLDPYISTNLRPHQIKGVTFLYKCVMGLGAFNGNGAILADEMGLGKTLQCISLIWTLLKQGPYSGKPVIKRCIIVTPGSLVKNWSAEFKKWLGSERIRTFPVGSDKRIQDFAKSFVYPVMIVSYEMLLRYVSDVRSIKFDLIICDEAHRLKNFGIKTTAAITGLGIKKIVLLTGTPIQNDLKEFYCLGQLCNPGIFGTMSSFRQVFENPINKILLKNCSEDEEELGNERAMELKRMADMFVLRRTFEVNKQYLPPKVELAIFCGISSMQKRIYEKIIESRAVRSCLTAYSNGSKHLVCISILKKLCNHPVIVYQSAKAFQEGTSFSDEHLEDSLYDGIIENYPENYDESFEIDHSGKLGVLNRLLDEFKRAGEKAVVVSNSTKTLDVVERLLKARQSAFLRLDGQTSTEERLKRVDRFNSKYSSEDIFLLSSKAGGTGLNLIGASRLILYDIDWNPANDIQAMARIWRDGQTKKVFIYRLLSTGTIEEKMFQRQIAKQSLSGSIVDLKIDSVNFSHEDLKDLFQLQDCATCSTHELLGCSCTYMPQSSFADASAAKVARPSQLGVARKSFEKKHYTMAELMSWSHIQPGENERLKDDLLKRCLENVTFVFQNESDTR